MDATHVSVWGGLDNPKPHLYDIEILLRVTPRTDVLVKRTSDHCKTVEFPMKACWKEDAQAAASEPQEETAVEYVAQILTFS